MAMEHLVLIDGSGYIFRAYYALPEMKRSDGTAVQAVYGFCRMVSKLFKDIPADGRGVVFDAGGKTFRNDIYPPYKAHREAPPEDLIAQFPIMREAADAFNLARLEHKGYEADDIMATWASLAQKQGVKVTLVSSDKDFMQLVGPFITLYDPMKNSEIGEAEVKEKFGVGPERVVDVQALAGDSSDNIPGVPGIGVKTAALLINEFGNLENLLHSTDKIPQPKRRALLEEHAEMARLSFRLATLKKDVPMQNSIDSFSHQDPVPETLKAFLETQNFKSLARDYGLDETPSSAPSSGRAPTKTEPHYDLIQDEALLKNWIDEIYKCGRVAIDTETDSLDAGRAKLVGISLATNPGRAAYIPLGHAGNDLFEPAPQQISLEKAIALLKPVLEDEAVLKTGHNLKYDYTILARQGIRLSSMDDTMLMSFCLDGGRHRHNLDDLARIHLGHQTISFTEITGKGKNQLTFDQVPLDKACEYAAEDADISLRLWHFFTPRLILERRKKIYEMVERPLITILAEMEQRGVYIEKPMLEKQSKFFEIRIAELATEIFALAGETFNIASARQLGNVLFDKMGLPPPSKTATGQYATGSDILEPLSEDHKIIAKILDWRHLSKLKSTYTDALAEAIDPETKRIHTRFVMTGAQTGRLSSTNPNLQNIPIRTEEGRGIRRAFVAPPGHILVSLDYSQIELRLAVHIAGLESLGKAIAEGGDIHSHTASEVFGVAMEAITPELRRRAKAVNFGILYGISAHGLAKQLRCPRAEAHSYIEQYLARYRGIADYMENMKAFCHEKGYVETLFGRAIHLPGIADKNPSKRHYAERQAINAPIQGTAADIIKRAMNQIVKNPDCAPAKMILQVHDELLFEIEEEKSDAVLPLLCNIMEEANLPVMPLKVPLSVEVGKGHNWDEAH